MKRLIVLGILSLLSMQLLMAQPPVPTNPDGGFKAPKHSINRQDGPVGTASLLLLTLGGATLGYKIVNNKKNNNRKEN